MIRSSLPAVLVAVIGMVTVDVAHAGWRQILPASGGTVYKIEADSNGVIFMSTNAGLLKSSDGALTWTAITAGLPTPIIRSMAVDPSNPGFVIVATSLGMFRSRDAGITWQNLNIPTTLPITQIAIARTNPNLVLAATYGDFVYRSTDGGDHWQKQTAGLTSAPNAGTMTSMAIDPTNANRVYTSCYLGRLFRSDDGGVNWSQMGDSGIWANGQIHIAPTSTNILYMTHQGIPYGRGSVLKSVDFGNTWTSAGDPLPPGSLNGAYDIAIHPSDANTVLIGSIHGLIKTITGGGSWAFILTPPGQPLQTIESVAFNPRTPSQEYAGSLYYGVYESVDDGVSWSKANTGFFGAIITGIEISPGNPKQILAGVDTVGFLRSLDNGNSWLPIGTQQQFETHRLGQIVSSPADSNLVIATSWPSTARNVGRIWRSTDDGGTFSPVTDNYASTYLKFNPLNPSVVNGSVYDNQEGFAASTDNGQSWSVSNVNFSDTGDFVFPVTVVHHPTLSNVAFSCGIHDIGLPWNPVGIFWSNTSGVGPWDTSYQFGHGYLRSMALDQRDPSIIYVAGTQSDEGISGVFKFQVTYSGASVASVTRIGSVFNNGLTNTAVSTLLYDRVNGYLYAATPSGVFRSSDGAASWTFLSTGLPYVTSSVLALSPDGNRLLVGTGGGIWEFTDTSGAVPAVTVSPRPVAFASVPLGSSDVRTVAVTNSGSTNLTFNSVSSSSPVEFSITNRCSTTLSPGGTCSIDLRFSPAAMGLRTANLVLTDNAADSPQIIAISGTGTSLGAPVLKLSSTSLSFANQPAGTTSEAKAVTLSNAGNAPLIINSVTKTGAFDISSNSCGRTLDAGGTCTLFVTFTPAPGLGNLGSVTIDDNAAGSPHTVALSGQSLLDSDGDGIPDDWEVNGVTVNGEFLDLRAMGANPLHKDIFVEIDWMKALDHNHQPKLDAVNKVVAAFANAPVSNPDNLLGISLHVDCGPTCPMIPATAGTPAVPWGLMSQSNYILHVDPITASVNELLSRDERGHFNWASFDLIKQSNFSPARAAVFRYSVFAHYLVNQRPDLPDTSSGLSRSSPSSDFILSLGWFGDGTVGEQAGTLMHELGHGLGLTHGGGDHANNKVDSINYKPNYLSVMNYLFQTRGLIQGGQEGNFDFSRIKLDDLNEATLDENLGLSSKANPSMVALYGTRYFCPDQKETQTLHANQPIDWNCNHNLDPPTVFAPISTPPPIPPDPLVLTYSILSSYTDWDNLVFTGGSIGQPGAPPPPKITVSEELTVQQDQVITSIRAVSLKGPGDLQLAPGATANLVFVLTNKGSSTDTFTISASANLTWADLNGIPAQISLASKASMTISVPIHVPAALAPAERIAIIEIKAVSLGNPLIVDTARSQITAGAADLRVSTTPLSGSVFAGSPYTTVVTVFNAGMDVAQNIVFTFTPDSRERLVSATSTTATCTVTSLVRCVAPSLISGAQMVLNISLNPNEGGTLSHTASAASDIFDPQLANNTVTSSVSAIDRPGIAARVSSQSRIGSSLNLMLELTNTGKGDAASVVISQVTLRTIAGTGAAAFSGPGLPLDAGMIRAGQSRTVVLTLAVLASVTQLGVTERGQVRDVAGNTYAFSLGQSVIP
jgi:photosystem II stability/assembly factor-like uncharacterized protein